jgi:hypothetical protein
MVQPTNRCSNQERVEPVQEYVRDLIDSIPVKVVDEYQKVIDSYSMMRAKEVADREKAKVCIS